jgi:hypothetical protein
VWYGILVIFQASPPYALYSICLYFMRVDENISKKGDFCVYSTNFDFSIHRMLSQLFQKIMKYVLVLYFVDCADKFFSWVADLCRMVPVVCWTRYGPLKSLMRLSNCTYSPWSKHELQPICHRNFALVTRWITIKTFYGSRDVWTIKWNVHSESFHCSHHQVQSLGAPLIATVFYRMLFIIYIYTQLTT